MKQIIELIENKLIQYLVSLGAGLLLAFETSLPFLAPCFLSVLIDVLSAYLLARRVHKKYPTRADGKFKSGFKFKVAFTLIIGLLLILLAAYVDRLVLGGGMRAVRAVTGVFLFYQIWSILENLSSECDSPIARALQRIMVNKAERHLNVPLEDILLPQTGNTSNPQTTTNNGKQ